MNLIILVGFIVIIVFLLGFSLGLIKGVNTVHSGERYRRERMYRG